MNKIFKFESEKLANWYFRLNGFFTIPNFVVHPEIGRGQRTDIDVLGVRFPNRKEIFKMEDHNTPICSSELISIVLAEVKLDVCRINQAWRSRDKGNYERVLRAIGLFKEAGVNAVANQLYENGHYSDKSCQVSLVCIGKRTNHNIRRKYNKILQLTWEEILRFIYGRSSEFRNQKSSHGQWEEIAKELWDCSIYSKNENEFIENVAKRIVE